MADPTKIQHPLLRRPGTSQRKRLDAATRLSPARAPVDGRTLGDMLDFVHQYARQLVFHAAKTDDQGQPYVDLSNWLDFFEHSLPFILNRFSKTDFDKLEADLQAVGDALERDPGEANLRLLLDLAYFDLIDPVERFQQHTREFAFDSLVTLLDHRARTALLPPLRRFIELSNAAATYFCFEKLDFLRFSEPPWEIPFDEIFQTDESFTSAPGGRDGATARLGAEITKAARRFLKAQRAIADELPGFLGDSIALLEKRHEPHLGLLFAFLRLFEHFQGDLNALTQKHLDFFYADVLRLKRRQMEPDQAHLVFEVGKHLGKHPIKQGTLFKGAKDSNNTDILFRLDEEIVIDEAKVKALKTLYLNHSQRCIDGAATHPPRSFVEGVYIAPVADSADGKGEQPFQDGQSKNWATLGSSVSKYISPDAVLPQNQPFGRVGFILASPVLWLNEGRRTVTIAITCDASHISDVEAPGNLDVSTQCLKAFANKTNDDGENTDPKPFSLEFSGEEGWFKPKGEVDFELEVTEPGDQTVELIFDVTLGINEPAVDFYDEEKIGEFFAAGPDDDRAAEPCPFPMVKIELDPEARLQCESNCATDECCLANKNSADKVEVALYHFLRYLRIKKAGIDVKVCGVRNLIVQNEESLQDVNSPVLPFGARPKVGAEFFIGSKEVFCKNWQKFWLHVNWKDKPDLEEHYKFYAYEPFEDGNSEIVEDSFLFEAAVLENFLWTERERDAEPIFKDSWDLRLMSVSATDELVDEGRSLVIVALVGADLHIRMFNASGEKVIDKSESELVAGTTLTALKQRLNPFPDESTLSPQDKQEIIANAISIAGYTLPCGREIDPEDLSYYKEFRRNEFVGLEYEPKSLKPGELEALSVNSDKGFFRMTLGGVSFQHDRYAFVLARKLIELSGGLDPTSLAEMRRYLNIALIMRDLILERIKKLVDEIDKIDTVANDADSNSKLMDLRTRSVTLLQQMKADADANNVPPIPSFVQLLSYLGTELLAHIAELSGYSAVLRDLIERKMDEGTFTIELQQLIAPYAIAAAANLNLPELEQLNLPDLSPLAGAGLEQLVDNLDVALNNLNEAFGYTDDDVGLPKEPYTPLIKALEVDYCASADKTDIEIIHLHPFSKTSKTEVLKDEPTLLPTFTDEGTLFIGLEGLRKRSNLHLLFQFAEATADSESDRAEITWHYLAKNAWHPLRPGFEVLSDATEQMTRSGIVKIAVPEDISNKGNTLMPPPKEGEPLFWLKVSAKRDVAGVAELLGVHAQAALATYKPKQGSDLDRVGKPLAPEQISKPLQPDFGIKSVEQLYKTFGGRVAEAEGATPARMGELLRHKDRSVDAFDIEHLVLDAFPELFKCKCISHTMGLSARQYRRDLEVAPGFLVVAVVPDLKKLDPGDLLEPRAPRSILGKVEQFLKARMSTFARVLVMNPRYEPIHVKIAVRLKPGVDKDYHLAQLKTDLGRLLSPWYLGDSDKLSFGQEVAYSDVLGFVEGLDYVEQVTCMRLYDFRSTPDAQPCESGGLKKIVPLTARSILTCAPANIHTWLHDPKCCEQREQHPEGDDPLRLLEARSQDRNGNPCADPADDAVDPDRSPTSSTLA